MHHSSLSRCANQAAVRGVASVHTLLETLDLAQSKRGVSAKKALRDYARSYFELLPALDPSTIQMLLIGSSNLKGLISACGTTSWKQIRELKKSSVQALELLARLLDDETNPHATHYREQLSHISKQQLKQMKLDRHVLSERAQTDVACLVIGHVLSSRSDIEVPFLLESADARSIFSDWEEEQRLLEPEIDAEEYDGAGYFDIRQHKGPKAWVDINEEEIDSLAAQFDGEREDGGPMGAEGAGGGGGQSEDIGSEAIGKDPLGILDLKPGVFKRQQKKKFWAKRNKEKHERQASDQLEADLLLDDTLVVGSSSPYDEDFSPVLFLLEFHRKTSFKNVQRGLQNLREIVDNRVNLMRQLVHDHFDQFVNCKDAIDSIHVLLSDEMSSSDSDSRTGSVLPELRLVLNRANKIYQPMLERNMEADRIRSVLAVLKRFHFLFAMPGNLRRNIKAQHYDKVVRDYQKVKLLQDSDVALLGEVLSEIHLIISQFRTQLKNALHDPNGIIEEQTRLISYLVELDCEQDPVWYFLDRQQEWICSEMRRLESKHLARTRGAAAPAKEQPRLDTEEEEPESSGTSSNRTEEENGLVVSIEDAEGVGSIDVAGSDHSTQKLVWSLTSILRSRMPRLWRLTRDVVLGKAEREHSNAAKDRVNIFFGEILNTYANVVEKTIVCTPPESKTTIRMPPSMEANICQILRCHEFLASLGIPSAFIASIRELSDRSAQFFIEQSLRSAVGDIARFPSLEDWHIDDDIHCCSVLPRLFRERITKLLDVVRQICAVSASAASWVAQRVSAPLLEIFRVFTDCLHQLAFKHHSGAMSDSASELSSIDSSLKTSTTKLPKSRRSEDQHLLLIISNSVHTRTNVMPDLWSAYVELLPFRVAALSSEFNKVVSLMKTFESMVLERFLRCKTLSLNAIIRKGIMTCGIAWHASAEPKDLRGYVLELLLELVFVHEQVNKISPDELGRVLRFLLLQISIGFDECLKQIDEIGVNGAAQLLIEIVFVKRTLKNYLTSESSEILKQIESELQEATGGEGEGKRGEILHSGRAATNIMFECFR